MNTTLSAQEVFLQYIKTGEECYRKVYDYIQNGCKGHLNLPYTTITSLPEGLWVGGDLNLRNTSITSLPEGLWVAGDLYLANTPITSLPEGLWVGDYLNLVNTLITSLPEGLWVGGSLDLRNTPMAKQHTTKELRKMLPNVQGEIIV